MTDWRALCEELTNALNELSAHLAATAPLETVHSAIRTWNRARAALAQPEPEVVADGPAVPESREPASVVGEPSDEELLGIAADCFAPVMVHFARAALARWGRPAPVPTEGEVAELVAWLRDRAAGNERFGAPTASAQLIRAADLLEQRHPAPVPVPLSERLPGASHVYFEFVISDADDCTQAGGIAPTYAQALSEGQHYLAQYLQDGPHTLELRRVEVLPPGAFPLPAGEVR